MNIDTIMFLAQAAQEGMSTIELVIAICVPLATVVGAFLSWLSTRNSTAKKDLTEAETRLDQAEKEIEDLKRKNLTLEARLQYALGYIYQVYLRDMREGREPIPIPDELNMIKE